MRRTRVKKWTREDNTLCEEEEIHEGARIKNVLGLSSDSGPTPPGTSRPVVTDERTSLT